MGKAITISKQDPAFIIKTMDDLEHMLRDPNANPTYMQLSLLEGITDNFSDARCIGRGGSAFVYKGKLRNGMVVAVKKLYKMVEEIHEDKFEQEVRNLMRAKHKNIVRFLGYCSDTQRRMVNCNGTDVMAEERQRLLCFEFLPNESLDKYITDASCGLEWHVRYDIIKRICLGLQYLHMECNMAHMDLKPHNIFMDDNMVAKIGDFGTSRLINPDKLMVTSNLMGTPGYMAPEYINNGLVSKKADIFSFGIIMLELLTGSRPYDLIEESSMARYTDEVVGKWMKRLPNAAYSQQVSTCVLIAIECVSSDKDKRPTTECIINKLIKVESEIREKLINEGQESWSWVVGITNVTVAVVVLVLILGPWVLTIGVAVIVLCLQNPMSSWPRVVWVILFGILLTVLILMNPRAWVLLILKVPTVLLPTILVEVDRFHRFLRGPPYLEADLLPLQLLADFVIAVMERVFRLSLLYRRRWSWMTLLFTIVSILAALRVRLNTSTWSWVEGAIMTFHTINPVDVMIIAFVNIFVPDDRRKSRAWMILFAIEAVQATFVNLLYPISRIKLSPVATANKVLRFLVGYVGIKTMTAVLLTKLEIERSLKLVFLNAQGALLIILHLLLILLLDGPTVWSPSTLWSYLMETLWPWLTVLFALGYMDAILDSLLWDTLLYAGVFEKTLLYAGVVAQAANIFIIEGITEIFYVPFFLVFVYVCMCEEQ